MTDFEVITEGNPLYAEIDRLKRERDSMWAALETFMESAEEPPPSNCSCHISAPCSDCYNYSGLREAFSLARATLAQVRK